MNLDLHILVITVMCSLTLLLLRSIIPVGVGGAVLLVILQLPLITRVISRKGRPGSLEYFLVNELIVAAGVGAYLALGQL